MYCFSFRVILGRVCVSRPAAEGTLGTSMPDESQAFELQYTHKRIVLKINDGEHYVLCLEDFWTSCGEKIGNPVFLARPVLCYSRGSFMSAPDDRSSRKLDHEHLRAANRE